MYNISKEATRSFWTTRHFYRLYDWPSVM